MAEPADEHKVGGVVPPTPFCIDIPFPDGSPDFADLYDFVRHPDQTGFFHMELGGRIRLRLSHADTAFNIKMKFG